MTARLGFLALVLAGAPASADEAIDDVRADVDMAHNRIDRLEALATRLSGWLDVGFFSVAGDGSGTRRDVGHMYFPEYRDSVPGGWVFMGDPLSTAVNARGEPADTGESRALASDSIDAGGSPSAIVNALTIAFDVGVTDTLTLATLLDVTPRTRDPSDPDGQGVGDLFDLKLAQLSWVPELPVPIEIYGGKILPVLGVEYRTQEAPDRLTVTPSLVCRYTCGHPIGAGVFAQLLDARLIANVAVTNGSHMAAIFPLQTEIDTNDVKTVAGRVGWRMRGEAASVEVGASGAAGAQDGQPLNDVLQWQLGFDLQAEWGDLVFAGEYVTGNAEGRTTPGAMAACDLAPCLDFDAAYGTIAHRTLGWLWPYARVDWRDALHQHGATFVYVSRLVRGTIGIHSQLGRRVTAKAEYTLNREIGGIPQFPNDVFTTSLVVRY